MEYDGQGTDSFGRRGDDLSVYTVDIRTEPLPEVTDEMLDAFSRSLFADPLVAGPAPSAEIPMHTLSVLTAVEAKDPVIALDKAVRAVRRALERAHVTAELSEMKVVTERRSADYFERDELVSGSEIARRLGITRQRVQQLAAAHGRFPRPRVEFGTVTVWRWGDIDDWAIAQGRRIRRRRRAS